MRRPMLAVVPAAVIGILLVWPALARTPVQTAEIRLLVGSAAPTDEPARGAVEAHRELAAVYSRMVDSGAHVERVSEILGEELDPDNLTAAPLPDAPFVRIEASATSADRALDVAAASAEALRAQVEELGATSAAEAQSSLEDHTEAAADVVEAEFERNRLQERLAELSDDEEATASELTAARNALVAAEARLRTAQLRTDAAATSFTSGPPANVVELEPFGGASLEGSDRMAVLQRNVIIGLLLGGLVGTALATLGANGWRLLDDDTGSGSDLPPDGRGAPADDASTDLAGRWHRNGHAAGDAAAASAPMAPGLWLPSNGRARPPQRTRERQE